MGILLTIFPGDISKKEIEEKARDFGMVYKDEIVFYQNVDESSSESNPAPSENCTVQIIPGSTLQEVAHTLEKKGVIGDKDIFMELAQKLRLSDKILAGTYVFKPGEDVYTVILAITGQRGSDGQ